MFKELKSYLDGLDEEKLDSLTTKVVLGVMAFYLALYPIIDLAIKFGCWLARL